MGAAGIKFAAVLKVFAEGGSVHSAQGRLEISGANSVTILFSNATSFKTYRDISGDALSAAEATWSARRNSRTSSCARIM